MTNSFYQLSNEILKLEPLKCLSDDLKKQLFKNNDTLDLYFNHWICRKENLQRAKGKLDRGLFELSYSVIETEFNISNKKARLLVKRFIDNGIIEVIKKGNTSNRKTIFAYTSVYYDDEKKGIVEGIVKGIDKCVNFNSSTSRKGIVKGIVRGNSKKEKEKEYIKSSTSTKTSSISYTEMVTGTAIYKGKRVNIKRFDGEPKRYNENKYIEQDGYIYEIAKGEMVKVETYLKNNGEIKLTNNFGTNKELEDIKIKDPA